MRNFAGAWVLAKLSAQETFMLESDHTDNISTLKAAKRKSSVEHALEAVAPRSEAQDRQDLAHAFRLAEAFGFHEGICNHFSVSLDSDEERYLINPYGTHWSEMQPDSLLLIDGEGNVLKGEGEVEDSAKYIHCLLYTSPSPRDQRGSRMPSSA